MIDIDRFKDVNDRLGHLVGDYTLRELATVIRQDLRREDLFARFGGEEFALALVESTYEGATKFAERLRQRIETHAFRHSDRVFSVTISVGVASTVGDAQMTTEELLRRADEKLYQAKREGRNQVAC
jgi:diguanylate cyclase (GGDEF)-like protein